MPSKKTNRRKQKSSVKTRGKVTLDKKQVDKLEKIRVMLSLVKDLNKNKWDSLDALFSLNSKL